MAETLTVELGSRRYPIHFDSSASEALVAEIGRLQQSGRRFAVLTDRHVAEHQAGALDRLFGPAPRLVVAPGESAKSLAGLGQVWDFLAAERLDRTGALFAVGGGVMGDLGGFAAATYLRGIALYQLPTTLLAMVDSSVGGKTGLNLAAGKNLVGAFHQPKAVYVMTELLGTLPPREFAAGMAEVLKYGLLGDPELFAALSSQPLVAGDSRLAGVVRRCCAAKAAVVAADEFETAPEGGRALLNLGHTFAHAIERAAGYGAYLHGEAVAIGLAAAARLSRGLGLVSGDVVARIDHAVVAHGLPERLRTPLELSRLHEAMSRDKKVRAGQQRFVVLEAVGRAVTRAGIERDLVDAVWREIGAT